MEELISLGENIWDYHDVRDKLDEFLPLYAERPVKDNQGGMLFPHLFWTWYMMRSLQPENIIESGVWKGQGTWVMRQACPDARIFSIDPVLDHRVYLDEKAVYYTEDFMQIDWSGIDPERTVCFFDDHQNAYSRLMQMKWMGFCRAVFEDNYPRQHGDCYSCKKILSGCGLQMNQEYVVKPTEAHAGYFKENVKRYITLPPLYQNETTRWGERWEEDNYRTPPPVFKRHEVPEKYRIIMEEAYAYTWICYVELKGKDD